MARTPKRSGAGSLSEKLTFQEREVETDDWGTEIGFQWVDKFTTAARMQPMRGSETVIASRLAGVQPYRVTIRSTAASREIKTGWRVYDARAGADGLDAEGRPTRIFNIRSVANVDERNQWLELLVDGGADA